MKNTINLWRAWIAANPLTAILCSVLLSVSASLAAVGNGKLVEFSVGFFIGWTVFTLLDFRDWTRRLPVILLCASLLCAPAHAEEPLQPAVAPVVIGGVVIIVGGVIVYSTVKFCQKHFPKTPPKDTNSVAAAWTYNSMGSCFVPASDEPVVERSVELAGFVLGDGTLISYISPKVDFAVEDAADWTADLAQWGLTISGNVPSESYSRGCVPISRQDSPIILGADARRLITFREMDRPSVALTVERSTDLIEWNSVVNLSVNVRTQFRIFDVSEAPQTFYRITTLP